MASPFRILDRLVLGAAWPALCGAAALATLAWLIGGPALGLTAGPYAIAVGLAVGYAMLAKTGEYAALLQAGIAPRRIGASVVASALLLALGEAAIACAFFQPAVRTEYAGYVLMALQLPIMTSLALPVAVRSHRDEPWARMVLLLIGYAIFTTMLRTAGRTGGWAPGLEWFFVDVTLLAADVALYRETARPRPQA
ncbi:MAG TPA: hypothetical protein VGC72_02995 [Candidatus Elarobacter sp.]